MWTVDDIPELSGKIVIVTGANSGIGYEAALALAGKGAHTVLACRNAAKADEAAAAIRARHSNAAVEVMELDVARLDSVRAFAAVVRDRFEKIDVLCNNAGVMALPYCKTADGFEMQFGTNHLGHFALTGLLIDRLIGTAGSRIVNVSSNAHKFGKIRFDDLQGERHYRKWLAYGQSKIANLYFTFELERRLRQAGVPTIATACHPGYAATNLPMVGPEMSGSSVMQRLTRLGNRLVAQDAAMGALPTLYAAVSPEVTGGDYIGPDRMFETWGYPKKVGTTRRARDPEVARRLWEVSEELTGVRFEGL